MKLSRIFATTALLALGSFNAQAAWVIATDAVPADSATNPDFDLANQNATTVGAWLSMLVGSGPLTVTSLGDIADGTASIGGLGQGYLAIHYGGGGLFGSPGSGGYNLAFSCVTACATINLTSFGPGDYTKATSNYRFYGTTTSVPEPATLGLLGLGMLGMAAARRRFRA